MLLVVNSLLMRQQSLSNKMYLKKHTFENVMYGLAHKNIVRGLQEPHPVVPLGAMAQYFILHVHSTLCTLSFARTVYPYYMLTSTVSYTCCPLSSVRL